MKTQKSAYELHKIAMKAVETRRLNLARKQGLDAMRWQAETKVSSYVREMLDYGKLVPCFDGPEGGFQGYWITPAREIIRLDNAEGHGASMNHKSDGCEQAIKEGWIRMYYACRMASFGFNYKDSTAASNLKDAILMSPDYGRYEFWQAWSGLMVGADGRTNPPTAMPRPLRDSSKSLMVVTGCKCRWDPIHRLKHKSSPKSGQRSIKTI